jgi:hypothetical protein
LLDTTMTLFTRRAGLLLGALALVACDGGTSVPRPATVEPQGATDQEAARGSAVAEAPAVRVLDGRGQPMAGVGVTFAVTAGGGAIATPLATTDAEGRASAGSWTLGPNVGTHTATATVTGLAPVTFTALAKDPCEILTPYTLLSTVQGALRAQDCTFDDGEHVDLYSITFPQPQGVTFRMNSTAVDAFLLLFDPAGNPLAFDDDGEGADTNAALGVFAPAGSYVLGASSYDAGETGSYTLASVPLTQNANCSLPWVVPGVQLSQTIATTDCPFEGYYSDVYFLFLRPGQQVTLAMNSTAVDAWLGLYDFTGSLVAEDDDGGTGTNARLTFTSPGWMIYYVEAGTALPGETGAYTLAVSTPAAAGEARTIAPPSADELRVLRAGAKGAAQQLPTMRRARTR